MTKVRNANLTLRLPEVLAWHYTTASSEKLGVNQNTVETASMPFDVADGGRLNGSHGVTPCQP